MKKNNIVEKMTNEQFLEATNKAIEISTKPANPWKRKIVDKISQLLLVMKQGETIENKYLNSQEKGLYPNWKEVYEMYVGKSPVDKIKN